MHPDGGHRFLGPARTLLPAMVTAGAAGCLLLAPRLSTLPQNPGGLGLGPTVTTPILAGLAAATAVAAASALRLRIVPLVLMATVTACTAALVAAEFEIVVGALILPALLSVGVLAGPSIARRSAGERSALIAVGGALGGAALLSGGLLYAAWHSYDSRYGPTHPESARAEPQWNADWLWLGGVRPDDATVVAGGVDPGGHELIYWPADGTAGSARSTVAEADRNGVARFRLVALQPDTEYRYRIARPGSAADDDPVADASFRTPASGPQDLKIVVGSCARTGSNGAVFDAMAAEDPDLFLSMGDLHYANLVSDDAADHLQALGRSIGTPGQSALFSSTPTVWAWDDHDFGDDDSDAGSPSRDAVSAAYRRAAPHYGVANDIGNPISQAFSLGRVRVVVTDVRSMRTDDSMLGPAQEAWLIDELVTAADTHAVVIWANPAPWIAPTAPGVDSWGGYAEERTRIADALGLAGVDNLVMVSGDYHVTAIDDGTNSDYSGSGGAGFPVLHGGPLDRPGRAVGVPFSHGSFDGAGQFGVVEVADDGGSTVEVTLTGKSWDGTVLTSLELEIDAGPAG